MKHSIVIAVLAVLAALVLAACSGTKQPEPEPAPAPAPPPSRGSPASTGPLSEAEFKAMHQLTSQPAPPRKGEMIRLGDTHAYLSLPPGKTAPVPGIVVIHEWWGLNEHVQHWADRLASAGYAALAVDLYGGRVATTPDQAMTTMKKVDNAKAAATIAAALDFLAKDPRVTAPKRGVIGWCFGGGWSLQTALEHSGLDAAVIYYGQLETDVVKLRAIKAKVLGIFGTRDKGIPIAEVDKFEAGLRTSGIDAAIHRYDADHAFANPSGQKYDEASAGDAWAKVLAFLRKTLG